MTMTAEPPEAPSMLRIATAVAWIYLVGGVIAGVYCMVHTEDLDGKQPLERPLFFLGLGLVIGVIFTGVFALAVLSYLTSKDRQR